MQRMLPPTFLVTGGVLACVGAALPWLTLYAGLHTYSGLIGIYGWTIFALGAAISLAGIAAPFLHRPWIGTAAALCGVALCVFAIWLFAGVTQIVSQPASAMLDARAGPGLNIVLIAALAMICGGLRLR